MMKKAASVCLAFLLMIAVLAVPVSAEELAEFPNLPKNVCVVDDADMLSNETEQWLDSLNGTLQQECKGATIAVLTVQDIGALSAADYATQAFNEWGVGDKNENNGVLVLMCRTSLRHSDGDYYVALGKGLDGTQLSSELKTILNKKMEKPFSKGNYDEAVNDTVKAIEVSVRDEYGQGAFFHTLWLKCKSVFSVIVDVLENIIGFGYVIVFILGVLGTIIAGIVIIFRFIYHALKGDLKQENTHYDYDKYRYENRDSSSRDRYSSSGSHSSRSSGGFSGMGGGSSFGGGAGRD